MRVSLFSWNSNPSIDKPYKINIIHAEAHVTNLRADKIADGVYQMRPPEEFGEDRSRVPGWGFDTAWHIRDSAGFLVWQLRTQRLCPLSA